VSARDLYILHRNKPYPLGTKGVNKMNKQERKDRNEMIGHFIGYAIFALALPFLTVGYILWWDWCLTVMGK
jgi:hypothetical protein